VLSTARAAGLLALGLTLVVGLATPAIAADDDRVRAAFVLNLAKYVEWPEETFASPDTPFVVGVIGDADFSELLARQLGEKTVRSRPFEIRTIHSAEEARGCQLVYGGRDQRQQSRAIALELRGASVLSVAEYDRFAHVGGMVAFELRQGKISFEINRSAAGRSGLKVSSKLLRLASAVR
jgi:hypothetical protein